MYSSQDNREFMKVLHILQHDGELRPLIFEHESLLRTLKDMRELKAEQMLSILTAAETEMYESSKKNEELIQQQKNKKVPQETVGLQADLMSDQSADLEKHQKKIRALQADNERLASLFEEEKRKLKGEADGKDTLLRKEEAKAERLRSELSRMKKEMESKESDSREVSNLSDSLRDTKSQLRKSKQELEDVTKQCKVWKGKALKAEKALKLQVEANEKLMRHLNEQFLYLMDMTDERPQLDISQLSKSGKFANLKAKADFDFTRGQNDISRPRRRSIDA